MKWTEIGTICNILKLIYTQPPYIQRVVLTGTNLVGKKRLQAEGTDEVDGILIQSRTTKATTTANWEAKRGRGSPVELTRKRKYHSLYILWLGIDKF